MSKTEHVTEIENKVWVDVPGLLNQALNGIWNNIELNRQRINQLEGLRDNVAHSEYVTMSMLQSFLYIQARGLELFIASGNVFAKLQKQLVGTSLKKFNDNS